MFSVQFSHQDSLQSRSYCMTHTLCQSLKVKKGFGLGHGLGHVCPSSSGRQYNRLWRPLRTVWLIPFISRRLYWFLGHLKVSFTLARWLLMALICKGLSTRLNIQRTNLFTDPRWWLLKRKATDLPPGLQDTPQAPSNTPILTRLITSLFLFVLYCISYTDWICSRDYRTGWSELVGLFAILGQGRQNDCTSTYRYLKYQFRRVLYECVQSIKM